MCRSTSPYILRYVDNSKIDLVDRHSVNALLGMSQSPRHPRLTVVGTAQIYEYSLTIYERRRNMISGQNHKAIILLYSRFSFQIT